MFKITERIEKAAVARSCDVRVHFAQTGSEYITVSKNDIEAVFRVSDHAECYAPKRGIRQISVDPFGSNLKAALKYLKDGIETIPESEGPLDMTADQHADHQAACKNRTERKEAWQALREQWQAEQPTIFDYFRQWGSGRPAARKIARLLNEKVAVTYAALTSGKHFSRNSFSS